MSIRFACSYCGHKYKVPDNLAGSPARCKDCGTTMTIPSSAESPVESSPLYQALDDVEAPKASPKGLDELDFVDEMPPPPPPPPRRAKGGVAGSQSTTVRSPRTDGGATLLVGFGFFCLSTRMPGSDEYQIMAIFGSLIALLGLGLMVYGLAKLIFGFGKPIQLSQRPQSATSQHRDSGLPVPVMTGLLIISVVLLVIGLISRPVGEVVAVVAFAVMGIAIMVGLIASAWGALRLCREVDVIDGAFYFLPNLFIPFLGAASWVYYSRKYPHVLGYVGTTANSSLAAMMLGVVIGGSLFVAHFIPDEKENDKVAMASAAPVASASERVASEFRNNPAFAPQRIAPVAPSIPKPSVANIPAETPEDRTPQQWAVELTKNSGRSRAVAALCKVGSEAEESVLRYATDSDAMTRRAVAQVLAKIGTEQSIPALSKMVGDDNVMVAISAEAALRQIHPEAVSGVLVHVLKLQSSRGHQKAAALRKIAQMPVDPNHHDAVAAALEKLVPTISSPYRDELAEALAKWKREESLPVLMAMVNSSSFSSSQKPLLMGIAAYQTDEAAACLVERLRDRQHRRTAAEALVVMGEFAETHVAALLTDSSTNVRSDAIEVLGEIGTAKSASALTRVVRDRRNLALSRRANDAIDQIRERANEARRLRAQEEKAPAAAP